MLGRARKNPTKCVWRLEPDRRSNFFRLVSPPVHLCAVTYDWNIVDRDVNQPLHLTVYLKVCVIEIIIVILP